MNQPTASPAIRKKNLKTSEKFGEHLIKVTVQFKEAVESSLNVLVYPSFNGKAADSFYAIGREVQKILVNACTENNWGIPFSQLTLHLPEKVDEK